MKFKLLGLISVLLVTNSLHSQNPDSLRKLINTMSFEVPVLSPLPATVLDTKNPVISLNGTWKFNPENKEMSSASNIEVPGEWVMQGFEVKKDKVATYWKSFVIPDDWKGNRIKIRFDGVSSHALVKVNGKLSGTHEGSFASFEFDITDAVKPGENLLEVEVQCETISDILACTSQYAAHPVGGILRKVTLFTLPQVNISDFAWNVKFDAQYKDAALNINGRVALNGRSVKQSAIQFELKDPKGNSLILDKRTFSLPVTEISGDINCSLSVKAPEKWDPEHPNLYVLKLTILSRGKVVETVTRTFGFKQTEVRGNQVFVNNMPIKLRGVCRHEVMPLRGRSLSPGQWEEDVRLFREANVNYIRTSHYPPAPEFIEACNRLGMFVEVEGPFCWAEGTPVPENMRYPALLQPELEMVNTFRSDPSVLMWSIANESDKYQEYFSLPAALIHAIDPNRPRNYSQYGPDGDGGALEIGNQHYPGPKGPEKYADSKRPVTFDEYCHLNAYNRFELVTDPGIRDAWGLGFSWMWENMYHSKGVLGGALWAGIDDSFILPDGRAVGYGTWGPLDGWRRPKPEYWHVKKVYSPVRIKQMGNLKNVDGTLGLQIENRMHFSDLSECRFTWKTHNDAGSFSARGKPGETTEIRVKVPRAEKIRVDVTDSRGVVIDQYEFTPIPVLNIFTNRNQVKQSLDETEAELSCTSGNLSMIIDKPSGSLREIQLDGKPVIQGDALLMVLPLNGKGNGTQMKGDNARFDPFTATCKDRTVERMETIVEADGFILRIYDKSDEAHGYTEYCLAGGELKISYKYEVSMRINPRQVGLVFRLTGNFQQLEWERLGQWNYYPMDHIGRLKGTATAKNTNPISGPAGPVAKPLQGWSDDQNEMGTNDFRSTKMNILHASVSDGTTKVTALSDGSQSVRCWLDNGITNLLVASYSNMGSEGFFRGHAEQIDRPLKPGDIISGTVEIKISK